MKIRSLFLCLTSVWTISACGARTSYDELLGQDGGTRPTGGGPGSGGGMASGGRTGTGGVPSGGSGGLNTGGTVLVTGGAPSAGGAEGGTGGAFPGNLCCEDHEEPGCNVPFIEECVCDIDEFCCENQWDRRCVNIANNACLGACFTPGSGGAVGSGGSPGAGGGPTASGGGDTSGGDCCSVHPSTGCQNQAVMECVCEFDVFCCSNSWDNYCVEEAQDSCEAKCGSGGSGATGSGGATAAGGGTGVCEFGGNCGSCLCDSCPDEISNCDSDQGCLAIAWCVQSTACLPFDCYRPETCRGIIDQAGGLLSESTQLAIELSSCSINAKCPCQ